MINPVAQGPTSEEFHAFHPPTYPHLYTTTEVTSIF